MPVPAAVRDRCRAFLPPGEELHYLFPVTSTGTGRTLMMVHFLIAISETCITVISCSWFRRHKPDAVWARYPRATRLGPVETSLAPTFTLGNLTLEVDEEYISLVRAADAELSPTDCMPPDPLPEL